MSIEKPKELEFRDSPSGLEAGHEFESVEEGLLMQHEGECIGEWVIGEKEVFCSKCGAHYPKNKGTIEFAELDNKSGNYLNTLGGEGLRLMGDELDNLIKNNPIKALSYAETILSSSPNETSNKNNKAAALIGLGKLNEAYLILKELTDTHPTRLTLYNFAIILLRLGKYKEAQSAIEQSKVAIKDESDTDVPDSYLHQVEEILTTMIPKEKSSFFSKFRKK